MPVTHPLSILIFLAALLVALATAIALRRLSSTEPNLQKTAFRMSSAVVAWATFAVLGSFIPFFPQRTEFGDGDLLSFLALNTVICLPPMLFAVAAIRSPAVWRLVLLIPLWGFVAINVYRLGGWVIVYLGTEGLMTPYISLTAGGGDLIVGATALPLALALYKGWRGARPLAAIWAVFGLLEFSNAVFAVFLSFFGIINFAIEPAMVGHAPMSTIVFFQLPFGIMTHVLLLIRLRKSQVEAQ